MNPAALMDFRWDVVPGNNAFVVPVDSTRGPAQLSYASLAAGSAFLAPGLWRAKLAPVTIAYSIRTTTQNVTVDEQILTGNAGTSSDWETQGAIGTFTAVAGTTYPREFSPNNPDWRLLITAGATGPATIIIWGQVFFRTDRGA